MPNIVDDIYEALMPLTKGKHLDISDQEIEDFGERMKIALKSWAKPPRRDSSFSLRMSNIGKPVRRLWFDKDGSLREDDPFGYISQLTGYEEAEGTEEGGFLVINKENGELCFFSPDDLDKPVIRDRISKVVKAIKKTKPPEELCYQPVDEGKKGNRKLHKNCTFCPHKFECFKDCNEGEGLRTFKYNRGLTYFTKVVSTPRVEEVL